MALFDFLKKPLQQGVEAIRGGIEDVRERASDFLSPERDPEEGMKRREGMIPTVTGLPLREVAKKDTQAREGTANFLQSFAPKTAEEIRKKPSFKDPLKPVRTGAFATQELFAQPAARSAVQFKEAGLATGKRLTEQPVIETAKELGRTKLFDPRKPITRGVFGPAMAFTELLKKTKEEDRHLVPHTPFTKEIFGPEPVRPLTVESKEFTEPAADLGAIYAKKYGLPEDVTREAVSNVAFMSFLGLKALDLDLGTGSITAKSAKVAAKKIIKEAGEEATEASLRAVAKNYITEIGVDNARAVGKEIESANPALGSAFMDEVAKAPGPTTALPKPEPFPGLSDLSLKTVEKLKGKTTVSKQFIQDLAKDPDLKQPERDLITNVLEGMPEGKVSASEFAERVQAELLPLEVKDPAFTSHEGVVLPERLRGSVDNYATHVYESPIETKAAGEHFYSGQFPNYFAHARVEDVPGDIRRILEIQSDLFQKKRLATEKKMRHGGLERIGEQQLKITEHLRRLENKQALGHDVVEEMRAYENLYKKLENDLQSLKGRAPLSSLSTYNKHWFNRIINEEVKRAAVEGKTKLQFPTGETAMKVEKLKGKGYKDHPVYKFYEKDVGKYLKNKYGAKQVTDAQGVTWWEMDVKPDMAKAPVEAFGALAGIETEVDENGRVQLGFDPKKAALGVGAISLRRAPRVDRLIEATKEAGYKNLREIEDLIKAPIKRSDDTPSIKEALEADGINTDRFPTPQVGGYDVVDLAGTKKFSREVASDIRTGKVAVPDEVAMRTMRDGRQIPAVRQSGVFAPKEFETFEFKDLKGLLRGQSYNLRDAFFTADNVTARQAAKQGSWGPLVHAQYQIRQADAALGSWSLQKAGEVATVLEDLGLKRNTKGGRRIQLGLWGIDNELLKAGKGEEALAKVLDSLELSPKAIEKAKKKFKDLKPLSDSELEAVRKIRPILDDAREVANIARKEMNKPEIGYVENYGPLLQRQNFWNQMRQRSKTEITENFDFVIPNAKVNPHAIPRAGGMESVETNAFKTLGAYFDNVGNDIFISPQIEKLKAIREVLEGRGYPNLSGAINSFIRENVAGQAGWLDTRIGFQKGTKQAVAIQKFMMARNISALAGNVVWGLFVQPVSLLGMTFPRAGGITHGAQNTLGGMYDFIFSKSFRQQIKNKPTVVSKTQGKSVGMSGAGDLDRMASKIQKGRFETFNDFVGKFADWNEYWLTGASMGAGYRNAKRLGLRGKDADIYADWMGGATQSEYNRLARPLLLNNATVRFLAPFQTFAFELYRYSKTLVGFGGGMPLEHSQKINQAIALVVGTMLANKLTEMATGRSVGSIGSAVPIVGERVDMLIDDARASLGMERKERFGTGRSPISFEEDLKNVLEAIETYVQKDNIQPLRRELIKWGMGGAGIAGASTVNRFIDGMIANVTGMQTTRSGEFAFPVAGTDRYIAPLLGPYSTSAGKKYLNQQQESAKQKANVEPVFKEAQKLIEEGNQEEAQRLVDELEEEEWEAYKKLKTAEKTRQTQLKKVELYPTFKKAQDFLAEGNEVEAQALVDGLSDEEYRVYELLKKEAEKFQSAESGTAPAWEVGELTDESTVLDLVVVYADALKSDPLTAFQTMFTKENLRKVEGGTAIVRRMELAESQRRRNEMFEEGEFDESLDDLRLDHIVPLQLGGDNGRDNLQLVPLGIWEAYTPIENAIGRKLRDGEIKEAEAREMILDFKQGRTTAEDILETLKLTMAEAMTIAMEESEKEEETVMV